MLLRQADTEEWGRMLLCRPLRPHSRCSRCRHNTLLLFCIRLLQLEEEVEEDKEEAWEEDMAEHSHMQLALSMAEDMPLLRMRLVLLRISTQMEIQI